jgi:hypothetical protein
MEFSTTNLPFSAALVAASKLKLLRIDATPSKASLIFEDPSREAPALELEFLSGQLMVPASAYNVQLRSLRRSIEIRLAEARKNGGRR